MTDAKREDYEATNHKVHEEAVRFDAALPELRQRLLGRYVVFLNGEVVDHFATMDEAYRTALERFGPDGGFVVSQVCRGDSPFHEPPEGMCTNCGIRPAAHWWTGEGGVMAAVHGQAAPWCERCCVEAQLEHARKAASGVDEIEARLAELRKVP